MSEKHTPGPWMSRKVANYVYLDGEGWSAFARVVVAVDGTPEPEGEANARLIAAAPEMLEALKQLLNWHGAENRARAQAAIMKVEGRE